MARRESMNPPSILDVEIAIAKTTIVLSNLVAEVETMGLSFGECAWLRA
jgi:hypothetical protein